MGSQPDKTTIANNELQAKSVCPSVMEDYCRRLPKVELHAHLNGSINDATIQRLVQRHGELGWRKCSPLPPDWQVVIEKGSSRSLDEGFLIFKLIHQLTRDEESIRMVTKSVIEDFADDNCSYLELRSTPRAVADTGMSKESYVCAILSAIQSCAESGIQCVVRLILSIDRRQSVAEAMDTVRLAHRYKQTSGLVVGIDLSGDPKVGNSADFLPALREAKLLGLKLAIHVAEVADIVGTKALLSVGPDRVGHGTCLHGDHGGSEELVRIVSSSGYPLEVCLTSNVKCRTVTGYADHHFLYWFSRGHPLCICTDDKGVFATSLSEEYVHAAQAFSLSSDQLFEISLKAIDLVFADDQVKERLRKEMESFR